MDKTIDQPTRTPASETQTDRPKRDQGSVLRCATQDDIPQIHSRLMEAIETSEHYGREFKSHEMARLSAPYLAALISANPDYVLIPQIDGKMAGFMISGPEMGTLWLYWSYIFPELRQSSIAISSLRSYLAHWNEKRFHKIATYTSPKNRVANVLMQRYGFEKICLLESHLFGEDCLLYEFKLNKTQKGYDQAVAVGRLGIWRYRLGNFLKKPSLRARSSRG